MLFSSIISKVLSIVAPAKEASVIEPKEVAPVQPVDKVPTQVKVQVPPAPAKDLSPTPITKNSKLHHGLLVEGRVTRITEEGVYLDFGYAKEGLLSYSKWTYGGTKADLPADVKVGSKVIAMVVAVHGTTDELDYIVLSKIRADEALAWAKLAPLDKKEQRRTTVKVLQVVKNKRKKVMGLRVALDNGLPAFMPDTFIGPRPNNDLSAFLGKELEAEIISINKEKHLITVSRRRLVKEQRRAAYDAKMAELQAAQEELQSLSEGSQVTGTVIKLNEYGLLLRLSPHTIGRLYKTELSWDNDVEPQDVAKIGDQLQVTVLKVNPRKSRVYLSMIPDREERWRQAAQNLEVGQVVDCQVERLLSFGLIVKLANNLRGLIHISELGMEQGQNPSEKFSLGQALRAKITTVDPDKKRLDLSLTQVED